MSAHSITESSEITRLGGKEWRIRCACGITVTHPDKTEALTAFNAYHAALMRAAS